MVMRSSCTCVQKELTVDAALMDGQWRCLSGRKIYGISLVTVH